MSLFWKKRLEETASLGLTTEAKRPYLCHCTTYMWNSCYVCIFVLVVPAYLPNPLL